jgi:hypothetical protein
MGTSVRITPRPSGAEEREYNYKYLINQVKRRRNLVNYFNSEPKSVRFTKSSAESMVLENYRPFFRLKFLLATGLGIRGKNMHRIK